MRSRRSVEEWRRTVYRHTVTAKVKVYCLYLADHMRADLTVSVPRAKVASALDCSERRINDWNTAAREAGLLDVVVRGQKHVTAVYCALFPDPLSGTKSSPLRSAKTVPLRRVSEGHPGVPPVVNQPPELSPRGEVPNERRSEEQTDEKSAAEEAS